MAPVPDTSVLCGGGVALSRYFVWAVWSVIVGVRAELVVGDIIENLKMHANSC